MKYLLLMYHTEGVFSESELPPAREESVALCHELHAKGQYLAAAPLEPISTAQSVQVRNGKLSVTDGPFAETKEQLGGYILIDVDSMEKAVEIASRFPAAQRGTVEVRPIVDLSAVLPIV
ncbi:MAG: YciI family protein [Candidatus Hydrogenedentes bacterium]|nr:YciI family protein [Candidatus Hydrogenedentota bacterium]